MSPPALCECGCGVPTKINTKTNTRQGYVKGEPRRFIAGHQFRAHVRGVDGQSNTPERKKDRMLRQKYGISLAEYTRMGDAQNWRCSICGEAKKLYVDHDHSTDEVRGLLCNRCNIRLAALDDPNWMVKAQAYKRARVALAQHSV